MPSDVASMRSSLTEVATRGSEKRLDRKNSSCVEFLTRRIHHGDRTMEQPRFDRSALEHTIRPIAAGVVAMLLLLLLLGTAIREPQPHDIPVGIAGPPPVA